MEINQDTAGLRMVDVCERDLDFLLAEEIECNQAFRSWFLQHTGAAEHCHELVRLERSLSTRHGETDLLVVHRDPGGGRRALLIENKIAASFTQLQPERYRKRGEEGRPDDWENFATVLIAPQLYLAGVAENKFDYRISYEECIEALGGVDLHAAFKRRMLDVACGKAAQPWTRVSDEVVASWFVQARRFGVERFPDLPLPAEDRGRAPTSYWIGFRLKEFPQSRVTVEIKPESGVVDLRFFGVPLGELRRELDAVKPEGTETVEAQSGKSVSIRARHLHMDMEQPFPGQEMTLHPMLASADQFRKFAIDQREAVTRLLGY